MRGLLANDPTLIRATKPHGQYGGWTGLHSAAQAGHVNAVRLLLAHGADPNAREAGDNTYPLHWAAAGRHLDTVRALVDAGGDMHGIGDVHEMDVIGWASFYHAPDEEAHQLSAQANAVIALLIERGARHHIFSAMCAGDLDLIRRVVAEHPDALHRRMSRFEHQLTPLHFALKRKRYDILDVLIQLGADLEGVDASGQTALEVAMMRGDLEAMRRLQAAGAKPPAAIDAPAFTAGMGRIAASIRKGVPMIMVPDVAAALDWYVSIGFREIARYADEGVVNFGMVSFGNAELMLNMHGTRGRHDVSLWFYTDQIDRLYELIKSRQFEAAQAALAGDSSDRTRIDIFQDLYAPFYGGREFGVRDLNGYELFFRQD